MSKFDCPHCGAEHDTGDHPDHLCELDARNRFEFECECGAVFECHVDWEPEVYPLEDTLKLPEKVA